jgi:hypothetical protein
MQVTTAGEQNIALYTSLVIHSPPCHLLQLAHELSEHLLEFSGEAAQCRLQFDQRTNYLRLVSATSRCWVHLQAGASPQLLCWPLYAAPCLLPCAKQNVTCHEPPMCVGEGVWITWHHAMAD